MNKRLIFGAVALVFVAGIANTAEARKRHRHVHHAVERGEHHMFTSDVAARADDQIITPGFRRAERGQRRVAAYGGRPSRWCGWWLGRHLGMPDRKLWLARNWAQAGQNAGRPDVGVVVVWRSHVGIITGRSGDHWVIKSGNDGRGVRERPRSIAGAIAFRRV